MSKNPRISTNAEAIHEASLNLLRDPGIKLENDAIVERLVQNGAQKGAQKQVAKIPTELVQECLDQCPKQVILSGRSGPPKILSCKGPSTYWSCPGMNLDLNGTHRPFTSRDMADSSRLLDRLKNVDVVFGMSMDDVPAPARDVVGLRLMAKNTGKHIRLLSFSPEGADAILEMKDVVGEEPWFSMGFTAHGPLRWTWLALEIFRRTAGHGIPVTINGEPMAGVSGPVTIAGSAAVGNAEILAGIVVNQLQEPGRPCIYNLGLAHVMDMKTSIAVTGGPENALFAKVSAMMGRFYHLPSCSWVSTESMCADAQAAMEKMFGFHTHTEEGVSAQWGVGQLESELSFSPSQAVIDDEMISYLKRYQKGIDVNDETLAMDTIRETGISGSFLDSSHTYENFRSEIYMPDLLFRQPRDSWNENGKRNLTLVAEEKARELMTGEVDNGLTEDQEKELNVLTHRFIAELEE